MINVYTNRNKIISNKEIILDSDIFFNKTVTALTDDEVSKIKDIDDFVYLGNKDIRTPYGTCEIYKLSSGSKTIINVLRNQDKIFDVTLCGENALNVLFEEINNTSIEVILRHTGFEIPEGISININNERIVEDGDYLRISIIEEVSNER